MIFESFKMIQTSKSHGMIIKGIDFTKNDKVLISGSADYKCELMTIKK